MLAKNRILFVICTLPLLLCGLWLTALAGPVTPPAPPIAPDPVSSLGSQLPRLMPGGATAGSASPMLSKAYVTIPSGFPAITVTTPAINTAPGLVFAAAFTSSVSSVSSYLFILDNAGQPVYYQNLPNNLALDFKVLPDGTLSYFDNRRNAFVILDSGYQELGTVTSGSAQSAIDGHELQLLSDPQGAFSGHYLILSGKWVTMDMSKYVAGGNPHALVLQQFIQEVDRAGNLYWDWPLLPNVPVTATNRSLTDAAIDYSHCNALENDSIDTAGNVLLSCRHLDSIIKINRSTKQIMWHLGGKDNDFTFVAGPGISAGEPLNFYYQHDIRRLPNGHITLFDNHNDPAPRNSRVLEYALDEQTRTATLVRALHRIPDAFAPYMGNGQSLPNGNMMVGWGGSLTPSLTEFHPDGSQAFEIDLADPFVSYRAFRFPWTGHPTWPPVLVLQPSGDGINLTFSWNGATDVASYRILGGATAPATQLVKEQPKAAGFETSAALTGADAAFCLYQVVPVDSQGQPKLASVPAFNIYRGDLGCFHKLYLPLINPRR